MGARCVEGKEEVRRRQGGGKEETRSRQGAGKEEARRRRGGGKEKARRTQGEGKDEARRMQGEGKENARKRQGRDKAGRSRNGAGKAQERIPIVSPVAQRATASSRLHFTPAVKRAGYKLNGAWFCSLCA